MDKEVRKLITALERIEDVEVRMDGGHPIVTKSGQFITTLPTTPSDHRWYANTLAVLRRAGITPTTRKEKLDRPPKTLSLEDMQARLKPIREARRMAEFARFTQQLAEVRGLRSFKSLDSAAETISQISRGLAKRPQKWTLIVMSESLLEWAKWQGAMPEAIEPYEALDPVPPVETGPCLVIDLARLASKLAEFGIELEVR
jgi:hypothetical protein